MRATVYKKRPKFRAYWYVYRLANVIAWCPFILHSSCNDWVNKLANYLLQQFLHYFVLF